VVAEPVPDARLGRVVEMQAELGAAPEDVIGRERPFLGDEVVELRLVEVAAEVLPEVVQPLPP
jgi:hypothetical protein